MAPEAEQVRLVSAVARYAATPAAGPGHGWGQGLSVSVLVSALFLEHALGLRGVVTDLVTVSTTAGGTLSTGLTFARGGGPVVGPVIVGKGPLMLLWCPYAGRSARG